MNFTRVGVALVMLLAVGAASEGCKRKPTPFLAENETNTCLPPEMRTCDAPVVFCASGYHCARESSPATSAGCFAAPRMKLCNDGGSTCAGAGYGNGCEGAGFSAVPATLPADPASASSGRR